MTTRLTAVLSVSIVAGVIAGPEIANPVHTTPIKAGDLSLVFRDNSESPRVLSGAESLINVRDAPGFNAFDPDIPGAAAGLNFEHIISGHSNPANRFSPRHGRYDLYRLPDGKSVTLVRKSEDDPWAIASTMRYTVIAPHYVDLDFRCQTHDPQRFGPSKYAILFFANYMNDVADVPLHFRGLSGPESQERWISADGPDSHRDWNSGGSYRNVQANDLQYGQDHNFKLNVWSYDYPRYTLPFYYGLSARGMVYMLMFNKAFGPEDEIRFSIFKFKLLQKNDPKPRPAWDFQYVIHKVERTKEYGFKARVLWKKFVSPEDCLAEYKTWTGTLGDAQAQWKPRVEDPRFPQGIFIPTARLLRGQPSWPGAPAHSLRASP